MGRRSYCFASFLTVTVPLLAWQQPPAAPLQMRVYGVNLAGVSRPVRDLPPSFDIPPGRALGALFRLTPGGTSNMADAATQSSAPNTSQLSAGNGFEGIAAADTNPTYAPPDENLAVGPSHIVQTVNMAFAIFDKAGVKQSGFPKPLGSLYAGTGTACETDSQSDPVVRYDRQANRWLIGFVTYAGSFLITDSQICLAVSQTSDPGGAYYLYHVDFGPRLQDYPKFAVWPDGWYMSANSFLYGISLEGSNMCAWERDKLLVGNTAGKVICVVTGNSIFSGLLPSDWDGFTAPPSGSPNYFLGLYSTSQLDMFKMKPNYANPSASQVTGPIYINVTPFNLPCGGGDCIPQAGTTQLLASIGDRVMYRLAYRNFGDHESLVVNHSVSTNNTVGVRWYEIRSPGGTPSVSQESTYAPDQDYRWMASMAMDQSGNIAVSYSKSSAAMNPSISITGREAADPLNTLRAEQLILTGTGSQLPGNGGSNRWGDYSSIETDPADDCTFWHTSEYLAADGTFNWRTRISSFKFQSCAPPVAKTNTTTAITGQSPNPSVTGQAYSVSVGVSPSGGSGTPTGTATINDGAGDSCIATLSSGVGSCNLAANTAVNRTLTATYSGDASFNGSVSSAVTHNVSQADTTTTITSDTPDPTDVGQSYTVSFTVVVNSPGTGTPTGSVSVTDGAGASCVGTIAGGSCSITSTAGGTKTLTAVYGGDSNFKTSTGTATHQVGSGSGSAPTAPSSLTAAPVYGTQGKKTVLQRIDVSWSDTSNIEDNFVLERWKMTGKGPNKSCNYETTFTLPAHAGTGTVIYADTSATTATCKYRVAARNAAGTSGYAETNVTP